LKFSFKTSKTNKSISHQPPLPSQDKATRKNTHSLLNSLKKSTNNNPNGPKLASISFSSSSNKTNPSLSGPGYASPIKKISTSKSIGKNGLMKTSKKKKDKKALVVSILLKCRVTFPLILDFDFGNMGGMGGMGGMPGMGGMGGMPGMGGMGGMPGMGGFGGFGGEEGEEGDQENQEGNL
jgi:hypothetical protein